MTWTAASGTITSSGLYTPPAAAGSDTITAQSGSLNATASVTVVAPAGWWKLNEGSGSTANDSSGESAITGRSRMANGDHWLAPANGTNGTPALQFNGTQ